MFCYFHGHRKLLKWNQANLKPVNSHQVFCYFHRHRKLVNIRIKWYQADLKVADIWYILLLLINTQFLLLKIAFCMHKDWVSHFGFRASFSFYTAGRNYPSTLHKGWCPVSGIFRAVGNLLKFWIKSRYQKCSRQNHN